MKKTLFTILLLFSILPLETSLKAQGQGKPYNIGASDLSVTFGYSKSNFSYLTPTSEFDYAFRSPISSVYLLNKFLTFSLRYGIQESDAARDLVKMKILEGSISGGPVIPLLGMKTDLGLSLYLPIRGILDYRFVNVMEDLELDTPNIYFIEPSLGAGIGFGLRPKWWDSKVRLIGSSILAFGVQKELGEQYSEDLRLLRKADLDLEVRINNLLGNLGLAFGFSSRSIRWSQESVEDFPDKIEFVTRPSRLPKWVSQRMFRAGVVWHPRKGS